MINKKVMKITIVIESILFYIFKFSFIISGIGAIVSGIILCVQFGIEIIANQPDFYNFDKCIFWGQTFLWLSLTTFVFATLRDMIIDNRKDRKYKERIKKR